MKEMIPNYPIFYVPMPIIKKNQIVAYIASKCYLLEENKVYYPDGTSKSIYTILYFYDQNKKRIRPIFYNDICINSNKINILFDDLDQCRAFVRRKNNESLYQKAKGVSFEKIKKMYHNMNDEYQEFYDLEEELLQLDKKLIDFKRIKKK